MDGQAMPPYLTSFNDNSMIVEAPAGHEVVRLANAVMALTREAHAHEKDR
jgi:hypothetical protein